MTIKELRRIHQTRPFIPFTMYLADGRQVEIVHPEFLFAPEVAERTVIAAGLNGDYETIDLLLVTSIKTAAGRTTRSRNGRNGKRPKGNGK